tara:strand:+ start:1474 stop:1683 length:210 start_codon:yes stop_codon:yes gene_type:complete
MNKALLLGLLLFGMNAQATPGKENKVFELKKKAIYYEIQAQLAAEEITLEDAQHLWQKKVKHLKKEEAK